MNGFSSTEIIDLSTVRTQDDALIFDFTCPRCGTRQTACLMDAKLPTGKSFSCRNRAVCGRRNMSFRVRGIHADLAMEYYIWKPCTEEVLPHHIDWGSGTYKDTAAAPLRT